MPLKISWPVCCVGSSLRSLVFHAVISLDIYTLPESKADAKLRIDFQKLDSFSEWRFGQ